MPEIDSVAGDDMRGVRYAAERAAIYRLLFELERAARDAFKNQNLHNAVSLRRILVAIFLTEYDGKQPTATNLATFLEMPRPTLLRRLDELIACNLVWRDGTAFHVTHGALSGDIPNLRRIKKAIDAVAETLSRLDD